MLTDFQNSFSDRLCGKYATNAYLNIAYLVFSTHGADIYLCLHLWSAVSALTLLVDWQEGHLACKK